MLPKKHQYKESKMTDEDELFAVSCVNCNNQVFKFAKNLLERNKDVYLKCPQCNKETKVTFMGSNSGIVIEKY